MGQERFPHHCILPRLDSLYAIHSQLLCLGTWIVKRHSIWNILCISRHVVRYLRAFSIYRCFHGLET